MLPLARRSDVLVQRVGDDLVVYDQLRDVAHSLTPLAVHVYEQADGTRDVAALCADAASALGTPVTTALVEQALVELEAAHLLAAAGLDAMGQRRRDLLRLLATAAVVPLVTSLAVPAPVLAQSRSSNGPNGNAPNGNAPNGNAPNGNAPNGNAPNGNSPNGNRPNGNSRGGG